MGASASGADFDAGLARPAAKRGMWGMTRMKTNQLAFAHAVKGAAVAAGLAVMSFAVPAAASQEIILHSATMDTKYWSTIQGFGNAYSNGVTFSVSDLGSAATYDLFGFCIDIFHDMYINTSLEYHYISNKGDPGPALTTNFGGATLLQPQIDRVSALVDIGFLLNRDHHGEATTSMQTAAIQSAIWETLNPGKVTLYTANLSSGDATAYTNFYTHYLNDPIAQGDRIFTIVPKSPGPQNQAFAIGWPIDVPEPGTWALMMVGFFSLGGALRHSRRALAA